VCLLCEQRGGADTEAEMFQMTRTTSVFVNYSQLHSTLHSALRLAQEKMNRYRECSELLVLLRGRRETTERRSVRASSRYN